MQVKRTGFFTLFSRNKDASVVVPATTPEKGPEENKPDEVDEGKECRRYSQPQHSFCLEWNVKETMSRKRGLLFVRMYSKVCVNYAFRQTVLWFYYFCHKFYIRG